MSDRQREIRARIAKRRKAKETKRDHWPAVYNEEEAGLGGITSYEALPPGDHPLFRKEIFYFKVLASLCLFLIIAVLFRNPAPKLDKARDLVTSTMKTEFEFASALDWYHETFGKPLVFLPNDNHTESVSKKTPQYALPASGKISESFEVNGQGIVIETDKDSPVESANGGVIIFAGEKDKLGKTVVIQHSDKSESWYGHLGSINVGLYDTVKKGKVIGTVLNNANGTKGSFYLAIKKGTKFVDPKQVIHFE